MHVHCLEPSREGIRLNRSMLRVGWISVFRFVLSIDSVETAISWSVNVVENCSQAEEFHSQCDISRVFRFAPPRQCFINLGPVIDVRVGDQVPSLN